MKKIVIELIEEEEEIDRAIAYMTENIVEEWGFTRDEFKISVEEV